MQEVESLGLWMGAGRMTSAGKLVDEMSSLQAVAVYACIKFIADIGAMVPRKLHRQVGDELIEAKEHPLYDILKNRPNPYMSAFSFWQTMLANYSIWGAAYALPVRRDGRVIALWPLPSARMKVRADGPVPTFIYTQPNGQRKEYAADEIFFLCGLSLDGYTPMSPVETCRQAIGLQLTTEEFVARFFGNGAWPGLVLEYAQNLKDETVDKIRESFEGTHGGAANSHRVAILEGGGKLNQINFEAQKSQLLESRNFGIEEICRIWRIPPHVIQHLLRSTNNNIEHQGIEVVKYTMAPHVTNIEQAVDNQLLTVKERMDGYYCKHNLDVIERGDFASRTEGITKLINGGVMTINEGRRKFELNPVEGGDVNRTQMQNVPIAMTAPPQGVTQ